MFIRESIEDDILRFVHMLSKEDDPVYPKYFIHYSNVLKISTNPSYFYNLAPLGVYAFPVFSYKVLFSGVEFFKNFTDRKYVFFLKLSNIAETMYLHNEVDGAALDRWISTLQDLRTNDEREMLMCKNIAEKLDEERIIDYASLYSIVRRVVQKYYKNKLSFFLWKIFSKYFGIDVIVDNSGYVMSADIEYQAVFMPPIYGYEIVQVYERNRISSGENIKKLVRELEVSFRYGTRSVPATIKLLEKYLKTQGYSLTYDDYNFLKKWLNRLFSEQNHENPLASNLFLIALWKRFNKAMNELFRSMGFHDVKSFLEYVKNVLSKSDLKIYHVAKGKEFLAMMDEKTRQNIMRYLDLQ